LADSGKVADIIEKLYGIVEDSFFCVVVAMVSYQFLGIAWEAVCLFI